MNHKRAIDGGKIKIRKNRARRIYSYIRCYIYERYRDSDGGFRVNKSVCMCGGGGMKIHEHMGAFCTELCRLFVAGCARRI